MKLNDYQRQAHRTAVFPKQLGGLYLALGLAGETGEVLEIIKKDVRSNFDEVYSLDGTYTPSKWAREKALHELGDVLWYLAIMAKRFGFKLETIAAANIEKLAQRKKAGTLKSRTSLSDLVTNTLKSRSASKQLEGAMNSFWLKLKREGHSPVVLDANATRWPLATKLINKEDPCSKSRSRRSGSTLSVSELLTRAATSSRSGRRPTARRSGSMSKSSSKKGSTPVARGSRRSSTRTASRSR